uniref:Uncharacterized protein n=1 Tax=Clytia hemisphaerica TaxID=252671 RepID=A0A7M5X508_9CNID
MNEKDQCSFCSKDFSELNKHNKEKHIEACRKKNGKRKSTSTITAYYQKKTKTSQTSSSESNLTESLSVREENNSDRNRLDNDVEIVEEVQVQGTKGAKNMRIGVELKYCSGFSPNPPINILQDFPYQILDSQPFVISKQKFHTKQCSLKDFVMDINVDGEINKDCSLLGKDSSLKRILARSQNDDPSTHIPNEYLTFNQLKNKLEKNQKKASLLSIENYKLNNKVEQLGKTLSFYKRFVIYIAENKVPRLHFLVNVALNNNRSIQYILGKCTDAVAGVYKARFDQDDKDLAFLVLKFGGPSLLDILYRANVLPSTSLAYRMSKKGAHLKSFVDMSYKDCFNENFNMKFEGDESSKFGLSIKSDETFINPRLRYDSKANKIVGTCYEHHGNVNLDFKTMEDAEILQEKLSAGEIHIPKECLVTGISSVVKNVPFQVILMWPTCTKDDFQGMCSMFNNISQSIKNKIDANPLNFNTDGDSTRRQAMHAITQNELDSNSDLGKKILALPLIDTNVGNNLETVNYDAKHLSKRCWTSLISGKLEVANIQVTKQDVGDIMKLADIRTHEVESLVYPRDKQNVPLASDCLLSFIEVIKDEAKREQIPFKLTLIKNVLVLVAAVYEAIICLYSYAEHSLTDQVWDNSGVVSSIFSVGGPIHCNRSFLPSRSE